MVIEIKDKKHIETAARHLLKLAGGKKIFAFYGAMGSGKTTLIKVICHLLGAVDTVSSPTFTLVNEYRTESGDPLYHIDFYRIRKKEEVFDFGIEEYLTGDAWCFMEWPELVEDILPQDMVKIRITVGDSQERILDIT
jgi:tRNA threonylcarbamoyladenosine biosynthesis protein TsaE